MIYVICQKKKEKNNFIDKMTKLLFYFYLFFIEIVSRLFLMQKSLSHMSFINSNVNCCLIRSFTYLWIYKHIRSPYMWQFTTTTTEGGGRFLCPQKDLNCTIIKFTRSSIEVSISEEFIAFVFLSCKHTIVYMPLLSSGRQDLLFSEFLENT